MAYRKVSLSELASARSKRDKSGTYEEDRELRRSAANRFRRDGKVTVGSLAADRAERENTRRAQLQRAAERYETESNKLVTQAKDARESAYSNYDDQTFSEYKKAYDDYRMGLGKDAYYARRYYEEYGTPEEYNAYMRMMTNDQFLRGYSQELAESGNLETNRANVQYEQALTYDIAAAKAERDRLIAEDKEYANTQYQGVSDMGFVPTYKNKDRIAQLNSEISNAQKVQDDARRQTELASMNLDELQAEIDSLSEAQEAAREDYRLWQLETNSIDVSRERNMEEADQHLADLRRDYREASKIQDDIYYTSLPEAEDFDELSQEDDRNPLAYRDRLKKNAVSEVDTTEAESALTENERAQLEYMRQYAELAGVDHITEYERKVFNYLYNTKGLGEAIKYLDYLDATVQQRRGQALADTVAKNGDVGMYAMMPVVAGADNLGRSTQQIAELMGGDTSGVDVSAYAYANEAMKENSGPIYALYSDVVSNLVSNSPAYVMGGYGQIFSKLAGISGWLSSGILGTSAAGGGIADALNNGYTIDEAITYGLITGISETLMEKALGSLGGGKLPDMMENGIRNVGAYIAKGATGKTASKVVNAFTWLGRTASAGAGEFVEEYLQEVLDPVFRNATLGENNDVNLFSEEALYSGLVGAISGGMMSIAGTGADDAAGRRYVTELQNIAAKDNIDISTNGVARFVADAAIKTGNDTLVEMGEKVIAQIDKGASVSYMDIGALERLVPNLYLTGSLEGYAISKKDAEKAVAAAEQTHKDYLDGKEVEGGVDATIDAVNAEMNGTERIVPSRISATDEELGLTEETSEVDKSLVTGRNNATLHTGDGSTQVEVVGIGETAGGEFSVRLSDGRVVDASRITMNDSTLHDVIQTAGRSTSKESAEFKFKGMKAQIALYGKIGRGDSVYDSAVRFGRKADFAADASDAEVEAYAREQASVFLQATGTEGIAKDLVYYGILDGAMQKVADLNENHADLSKIARDATTKKGIEAYEKAAKDRKINNNRSMFGHKVGDDVDAGVVFEGTANTRRISRKDKAIIEVINEQAIELGKKVIIHDVIISDGKEVEGVWKMDDGIHISLSNMGGAIKELEDFHAFVGLSIFDHEAFHEIKAKAPDIAKAAIEFTREQYSEEEWNELVEEKTALYRAYGQRLSREGIEEEITADHFTYFMMQRTNLQAIAEKYFTQAELAVGEFDRLMAITLGVWDNQKNISPEFLSDKETLQKASEIANRAIEAVKGNKKAASGETVKRFSIDPNFEKEYDEWVKNEKTSKKNFFVLGSTSKAMMDIGVNPAKIRWYARKIKGIQNKHPWMTDRVVKQIPQMLEYPILVMQSITEPNRVVVTGDVVIDGIPVIAALELRPNGEIENFVVVASAYERTSQKVRDKISRGEEVSQEEKVSNFQNFINTCDILYVDPNENRTNDWLSLLRLQLPEEITQYGPIGRVTYTDVKVNKDGSKTIKDPTDRPYNPIAYLLEKAEREEKLSVSSTDSEGRPLTLDQQEFFKNSVVRDTEGRLQPMYHGTRKGGFTVFRDWQYMTEDQKYAQRYADDRSGDGNPMIYKTYINVTNPFDTRIPEIRKLYEEQFLGVYGGTGLMESGLPDWTDGYDLAEFIEENELPYDGIWLDEGGDMVNGIPVKRSPSLVVRSSEQIKNIDNTSPTSDPDIRYSAPNGEKEIITLGMSDDERTKILSKKVIGAPEYEGEADAAIENAEGLREKSVSLVQDALLRLAEVFRPQIAVSPEKLNNNDLEIVIEFSKGTIKESAGKNISDPELLGQLFPILDGVIKNAVGIEQHANRYYHDSATTDFYELIGAYVDGDYVVPIRLGVKNSNKSHALYIIVGNNKIKKTEVLKSQSSDLTAVKYDSRPIFNISVSDLIENVKDGDVLRYVPDGMLTAEQKRIKDDKVAETLQYTNEKNDAKYLKYISKENFRDAGRMIERAARMSGKAEEVAKIEAFNIINDDTERMVPISQRYPAKMEADIIVSNDKTKLSISADTTPTIADLRRLDETQAKMIANLKQQFKLTDGKVIKPADARMIAKSLIKEYGINDVSVDEYADRISTIFTAMRREGMSSEDTIDEFGYAYDLARSFATELVENATEIDTTMRDENYEILNHLRTVGILLTDDTREALREKFGSVRAGMNQYWGRVKFVNRHASPPDTLISELNGLGGHRFDVETSAQDAVEQILDFVEACTPTVKNPLTDYFTHQSDAIDAVTISVMEKIAGAGELVTRADRTKAAHDKKIAKLKNEMSTLKKQYREEIRAAEDRAKTLGSRVSNLERWNESRKKTEVRHNIQAMWKKLATWAAKPKNRQYIPEGLFNACVKLLDTVEVTKSDFSKTAMALNELRRQYKAIETSTDFSIRNVYDSEVADMIYANIELIEHSKIYNNELNLDHLKAIERVFAVVIKAVQHGRSFREIEKGGEIAAGAEEIIATQKRIRDKKASDGKFAKFIKKKTNEYLLWTESPERVFHLLDGYDPDGPFTRIFADMMRAYDYKAQIELKARDLFGNLLDGDNKGFNQFFGDKAETVKLKGYDFTFEEEHEIEVTKGMMLSLWFHLQNDQNVKHLAGGVFVPDVKQWKNGNLSGAIESREGYRFDIAELRQQVYDFIYDSEYAMDFIDAAKSWFWKMSGEVINKTSLKVDGFRRAEVNNYYPIATESAFNKKDIEEVLTADIIAGNKNFLIDRVKNAGNPILLTDILSVLDKQITRVSNYAAFDAIRKDMSALMNYFRKGYDESLKNSLRKAFGTDKVEKYINELVSDLTGAKQKTDWSKTLNKFQANFARSALSMNPTTPLKQIAAYPQAAYILGWEPMLKATVQSGDVEEINKWTNLYRVREAGGLNNIMGYELPSGDRLGRFMDRHPAWFGWIEKMDLFVVRKIWAAAKEWTLINTDLDEASDEFFQRTAVMFEKAVYQTQDQHMALMSPNIQRHGNTWTRLMFPFITQPLQQAGIVYDAIGDYLANHKNAAERARAEKKLASAVSSTLASYAALSAVTMVGQILMGRASDYEDEEGNLMDFWNWLEQFGYDMIGNMSGMLLGGQDIYELVMHWLTGNRYYGMEIGSIQQVFDAYDGLVYLGDAIKTGDWQKIGDRLLKTGIDVAKAFGIPAGNIQRIVKAFTEHIDTWFLGGSYSSDRTAGQISAMIDNAVKSGDAGYMSQQRTKAADATRELLETKVQGYLNQGYTRAEARSKAGSAVKSALTSYFKPLYLEYRASGDTVSANRIQVMLTSLPLPNKYTSETFQDWWKNRDK